jgi:hypothetical protein
VGENFFSQNKACRVSKDPSFLVDFKNINLPCGKMHLNRVIPEKRILA